MLGYFLESSDVNENGEIYAFVLSDITLKEFGPKISGFALQYTVLLIVLIPIFGLLMGRRIKRYRH